MIKSIFWPASLGTVLVLRAADIATLFGLEDDESIFLHWVKATWIAQDGAGSTFHMAIDDQDAEKTVDPIAGIGQIMAEVTETAIRGERIGGQLSGNAINGPTWNFFLAAVAFNVLETKPVNELIRRSLVFSKDAVADGHVIEMKATIFPRPMIWLAETDSGDLKKINALNTIPGSERFQPLKSAGEEYHTVDMVTEG